MRRLIYNRKYDMIDANMSDTNIGARRNKSSRNYSWLIYEINHEQNSSTKHAQLVMQSFDYTQMFDSMCLSITMSDMYDCGVTDDLLVLLHMTISVNTWYGLKEPITIPELVAQGTCLHLSRQLYRWTP